MVFETGIGAGSEVVETLEKHADLLFVVQSAQTCIPLLLFPLFLLLLFPQLFLPFLFLLGLPYSDPDSNLFIGQCLYGSDLGMDFRFSLSVQLSLMFNFSSGRHPTHRQGHVRPAEKSVPF